MRVSVSRTILLVIFWVLAFNLAAAAQSPSDCLAERKRLIDQGPGLPAGDGRTNFLLIVLRLEKGGLRVDREKSLFGPTDEFLQGLQPSRLTCGEAKTILFDQLDKFFVWQEKPYLAAAGEERESLGVLPCERIADDDIKGLCQFSGSWAEFKLTYDNWQTKRSAKLPLPVYLGSLMSQIGGLRLRTPLAVAKLENSEPTDAVKGTILFTVADPIADLTDSSKYRICFSLDCDEGVESTAGPADIARALSPLKGRLWFVDDLETEIRDFYAARGLIPTVNFEEAGADNSPKVIKIIESPRIESIVFPGAFDLQDIEKALYLLLPDKEFRFFLANKDDDECVLPKIAPGEESLNFINIELACLHDPGSAKEFVAPYLNLTRFQVQQLQLASLDLTVKVESAGSGVNVVLKIGKMAAAGDDRPDKEKKTEEADSAGGEGARSARDRAVLLPNREGRLDPNLQMPERHTSFQPRVEPEQAGEKEGIKTDTGAPGKEPGPTPEPASSTPVEEKAKKNYLAGGFEYRSGQGLRAVGIYQRAAAGNFFTIEAGGFGNALANFSFFRDYIWFGSLHRRLSIQLTGSTDFQARRIFSGQDTDERRTGGLARAEIEWFRDLGGNLLRTFVEARRLTVELIRDDRTLQKTPLTTLDVGIFYLFQGDIEASYPRWIRLEPRIRLGLAPAANQSRFAVFSLVGAYHQKLPGLFEFDLNGRAGISSGQTPLFEQPSLGGEETVRGYRRDEAIGRAVWSVQPEVWAPLPGTIHPRGDFQRFLRRSVRLAGFFDAGGAYRTGNSAGGLKSAPGIGLRLIYGQAVLKFDWAYGLNDPAARGGRGRFYLNAVINLP